MWYPRRMDDAADRTHLREGTPVVFVDARQRLHYDHLAAGATCSARGDRIPHDAAIGRADGCAVRSASGSIYHVLSATLQRLGKALTLTAAAPSSRMSRC